MQEVAFSEITRPGKVNSSIYACPESLDKWYCLNGATCFQVKIYDAVLYNCWCRTGFQGLRCDYKYVGRKSHHAATNESSLVASRISQEDLNIDNLNGSSARSQPNGQSRETGFDLLILFMSIALIFILILCCVEKRRRRRLTSGDTAISDQSNTADLAINVIQNSGRVMKDTARRINLENESKRSNLIERGKWQTQNHDRHLCMQTDEIGEQSEPWYQKRISQQTLMISSSVADSPLDQYGTAWKSKRQVLNEMGTS